MTLTLVDAVHIDATGRILCSSDPRWVDRPLAERFDPSHAEALARALRHGWALLAERCWKLVDGRTVSVEVTPCADADGGGAHLALKDRTVQVWLDEVRAREQRRLRDAEIAIDLAREFADPLSVVLGRLELVGAVGSPDAETLRHLSVATEHARRVSAALRNLRMVGRAPHGAPASGLVSDAIGEALDLLGPLRDRVLVTVDPPDLRVAAQPAVLARILGTLARRSLETTGRSAIHARAWREGTGRQGEGRVRIDLGPSGRGQPQTAPIGGAFGFESALLAAIGGVVVGRATTNGTRFEVSVPHPARTRSRPLPVRDHVLVVGPPELAEAVAGALEHDGFEVTPAGRAEEVLDRDPDGLQHVLCDVILPEELSGLALRAILAPRIRGRFLLVADRLDGAPAEIAPWLLTRPLGRAGLLAALRADAEAGVDAPATR